MTKKISDCLQGALKGTSVLNYKNFAVPTCPIDIVRLISEIKTDNKLDLCVRNLFLNCVLSCDSKIVGSGFICAAMLCGLPVTETPPDYYRCDQQSIKAALSYYLDELGYCYKLSIESYFLGGPGCKVFFNNSSTKDFSIESFRGKLITAYRHEVFDHKFKKIENPRVVFIDGIVESVGEIDGMLQSLASEKIPACIFARGFSPDVAKTLSVNYSNKKLKVFPIVYLSGEEDDILEFCIKEGISCFEPKVNNNLRKCKASDMKLVSMVSMQESSCLISSKDGDENYIEIRIPSRLNNISGLLKDRINFGKLFVENCARFGISDLSIENNQFKTSRMAYQMAKKTSNSFLESLDNLHKIIAI